MRPLTSGRWSLCGAGSPCTHLLGAPTRARGRFMQGHSPCTRGSLCGDGSPCTHLCRRSALHPGDFPVAGKVTKGAPRAVPFGIPRCVVAALFALAALRSVSRRATFCHKPRPICHFGFVGKAVLFFSPGYTGGHTPYCQSVARQGCLRGCLGFKLSQPIPLGQGTGGSKGATPPSPEVQEPGGSW